MRHGHGKRVTLPPRLGADGKPNPKADWETFDSMGAALRARPEMTRMGLIAMVRDGKAFVGERP